MFSFMKIYLVIFNLSKINAVNIDSAITKDVAITKYNKAVESKLNIGLKNFATMV